MMTHVYCETQPWPRYAQGPDTVLSLPRIPKKTMPSGCQGRTGQYYTMENHGYSWILQARHRITVVLKLGKWTDAMVG